MKNHFQKLILVLSLCLVFCSLAGATSRSLVVQPAKTRVGIAHVILNIEPLTLTVKGLIGSYAIRIPLAPFMNDSGTIEIPMNDLKKAVDSKTTVHGTAYSREDGRIHDIACTFQKNSRVRIVVTTPDRVLSFEAPYILND